MRVTPGKEQVLWKDGDGKMKKANGNNGMISWSYGVVIGFVVLSVASVL